MTEKVTGDTEIDEDGNIVHIRYIEDWYKGDKDILKAKIAIDYCKTNNLEYHFYLNKKLFA